MKKLLFASALAAGITLGLQGTSFSHGGTYRGPGDTVPPGGGGGTGGGPSTPGPSGPSSPGPSGPSSPGPSGPATPGAGPVGVPGSPVTGGGGGGGPDLTAWTFWWEFNKEPYLNLKSHIHSGGVTTGSDGWFLGHGMKKQARDSLRPSEEQIRQKVVPALLKALETETNNDIVTGCLIALAKIGDEKGESGESEFQEIIKPFLNNNTQEIAETAAVSLGILAHESAIPILFDLLKDTGNARRELIGGKNEVPIRTRAFAAYGLALIGARTADSNKRQDIVEVLVDVLEKDTSSLRDIKVSCLIALGLVPIDRMLPEETEDDAPHPAHGSRIGQIEFLLGYLADEDHHYLVRAHVPVSLARLLDGLPAETYDEYRVLIAEDLVKRTQKRSKEKREVVQSCVLALGQIGRRDDFAEVDEEIRDVLISVLKNVSDQQARNFSLIACGQVGGIGGEIDGKDEIAKHLSTTMSKGRSSQQPWAALGIGVMGRKLADAGALPSNDLAIALRSMLADEANPDKIGAYAIAVGILGDNDSREILLKKLDRIRSDEARGYLSVALGLMDSREAIEPIQKIVTESKYRPDLLKQAAIALGMLGDKELVSELIAMLEEAKGLATQAALSSALGTIGDARSIDPLVEMLANKDITASARGFAAVALGIVADKEPLPWNSKIAVDLNYRASTSTLNQPESGDGILNIL
ncbi:MAG: HEAT repeat domain-containing protein [Planctomycetota bacterium]|nr:HEAT repeat domain-containing protein [Planctomycetota bacterium]